MSDSSIPLNPVELWRPKDISNTAMEDFRRTVNKTFNLKLGGVFPLEPCTNYEDLRKWSVDNIPEFWASVWNYTKIIHSVTYDQVLEPKPMEEIPGWFIGARLNFAENLLWCRDPNKVALISTGENRPHQTLSYLQLYNAVRLVASSLRKLGLQPGDRVAAYISNCPEAVIAMLAAASIGCIWASTSPDFGISGVLDRISQINPKVLFSVNAVVYNGRTHEHISKLKTVVEKLDEIGLQKVVVVPFVETASMDIQEIPGAMSWNELLSMADENEDLHFEQLPFDHPLFALFSSGTTGKPKCITHRAGGVLLQLKKEHMLHGGLTPDDVFFYYTTTGWMMWNWLVSGLSVGCTVILYDGSPFKPGLPTLWELADALRITVFGVSAKYIQSVEDAEYVPKAHHNLECIRMILSTGSPLKPESFDFVYEAIKKDVTLSSITGGTDICSLFAGYNVTLPVYRGEIQGRCLGMAVEAWVGQDKPVYGQSGDLVCTKPFPSMPIFFWNDPNNVKYRGTYFDNYASTWYHGDFVWINPKTGGVVVLGRSDSTLNPGGVRFGSAEIYNIVDTFKEIEDSLVIGQKMGDDERVVLFVKMAEGFYLKDELVARLKKQIREQLSPRHVPTVILAIKQIPYTINGKKVEVAVKRIISGQKVIPSGTLVNPESLDQFYNIPQLKL